MSAIVCYGEAGEVYDYDDVPSEAGAMGPNDVTALESDIDGHIESLNTAIAACPGFPASELPAWQGFYSSWQAEKKHWADVLGLGWLVFAEFWDASDTWNAMNGYAQELPAWDAKVKAACPGYQPPPGPPHPTPPPPGPAGTDWGSVVKWGAAAIIVVVVAGQVGLPRLFGPGGLLTGRKGAAST